eukprot:m.184463 g.184463  ORF g.184463 m.184463 type:complete len:396 (+) comp13597_c2_seq2:2986-4173(+)
MLKATGLFSQSVRCVCKTTNTVALSSSRACMSTLMPQTSDELQLTHTNGVLDITLNRPKALNALTLNMVKELQAVVKFSEESDTVGVVCMRGAGSKAFCAGGDVVLIAKSAKGQLDDGGQLYKDFFREEYVADYALATMKTPYVAILNGITMGGGVGVSVHGRYRVATEKTMFAMPETAIGFFPDVGGSYFLPRLQRGLGWYLGLTGARLKGMDVVAAGIATHFISTDQIEEFESALAGSDLSDASTVENVLANFNTYDASTFTPSFSQDLDRIENCFSPSNVSSVSDIQAKLSEDGSEWAQKTLSMLNAMCPGAVSITFEQLRRGSTQTLAECLNMEYTIALNSVSGHDFYAGVNGKLMKGPEPVWEHASVSDVTDEYIQSIFTDTENTLNITP